MRFSVSQRNRNFTGARGFTLIESAVVIAIAGVILVAGIALIVPVLRTRELIENDQKMENVAKAIDFYARQNFRVPCPAVPNQGDTDPPFGYEAGSGTAGNIVPANCGAVQAGWEGIVPFKTLNIPEDWIRDAWGRYMTYAISPGFSQDVGNAALPVHSRCRTSDWFDANVVYEADVVDAAGNPVPSVLLPKNERKARFCCSGVQPGDDLVILDVNSKSQMRYARQTAAALYQPANVTYPNPMAPNVQVPDNDRSAAPVYVLLSHGPNGDGAYTGQGAGIKIAFASATPDEQENADGDRTYYEIPRIDRANAEQSFDDEMLWRTQDMIFAAGGESCSLP